MRMVASVALLSLLIPSSNAQSRQEPELVASTPPRMPEEERAGFRLPPGFEAQLVASEPAINKPMNLAFDDRGRLWVTSTVEYPYPAKPGTKPRDRVVILDDIAPDGRARKISTFADGLNIPIGVLPLGKGDSALVHSIPAIRRLTDTDGDGKADRSEEVYTSFDFRDTHGMTNAFTWGFDGWIYACHGFSNESSVKGSDGRPIIMESGNIYRLKADGSHAEYVTHGQVNPFGLAFDPLGNLYSCDCHSRPIYCLLPGAYYPSFGKPDDGLGFGPEMMQHDHGSTGIAGIVYYAADHFPAPYRDTIFIGNVVTSRINRDRLVWTGASPAGVAQPDFLSSDDPWFRPVDIELGPDGALYVADFYNKIIGHYEVPLTHPGRDRERGRIWRIVYKGSDGKGLPPASPRRDWTAASVEQLIADLGHPNLTVRIKATNGLVARGRDAAERALRVASVESHGDRRVHALWALHRLGILDAGSIKTAMADGDAVVRVHALKILGERNGDRIDGILTRSGLTDSSPFARRAAAEALARHPSKANVGPLLVAVRSVSASDTHLKHATRIALRDQLAGVKDWEKTFGDLPEPDRVALADVAPGVPDAEAAAFLALHLKRGDVTPEDRVRFVRHVARYGRDADQRALAGLLTGVGDRATRASMLKAIFEGEQARGAVLSVGVAAIAVDTGRALLASGNDDEFARGLDLVGALKLGAFRETLAAIVADRSKVEGRRDPALATLAEIDPASALPTLIRIVGDASEPDSLRGIAAEPLAASSRPEAIEALIKALATAPGALQAPIATGLSQTPEGVMRLLDAIGAGKASARLLQERGVEVRLAALDQLGLKDRVAGLLKGLPPAEERIQAIIAKRRGSFDPTKADLVRGATLFEKSCSTCHQLSGKGARVGPQLDGVGLRGVDRLLEDVLDPNRNVDQAFRVTSLVLKDGRAVSGLLLREEGEVLVLADAQGKDVRVPKGDVEDRSLSQLSPMPANWNDQIPEAEFPNLLAYLLYQKPKDEPTVRP